MALFYGNGCDKPIVTAITVRDCLPAERRHHYADGYSMAELAKLWTSTRSTLPSSVADRVGDDRLVSGHFEFSVPVWGRGRSETDIMVFTPDAVIAVEAKTDEPLDDTVGIWIEKEASRNPRSPQHRRAVAERYAAAFGISVEALLGIRYQLLHRTLSAALTARTVGAAQAWMVVQSFPTVGRAPRCTSQRADFDRFVNLVGVAPVLGGCAVRLAWVEQR